MSRRKRNRFRHAVRNAALALALAALAGCASSWYPVGDRVAIAVVENDAFVAADGARQALHRWLPDGRPRAVIVGVHGFNDYGNAFAIPAATWTAEGLAVYAFDQRGFGASDAPGLWAGVDAMVDDLAEAVAAIRARHPDIPVHVIGISMGGAVAMVALARGRLPEVTGTVLVAPAVWGRETMSFVERALLSLTRHTMPWLTLTGRGLDITPSDNIAMLRALGADPLVIKETRVDTIAGLVDLMDAARAAAPEIDSRLLVLYGAHDEIIPRQPTVSMLCALAAPHRVVVYRDGYHMLLRDLQADLVHRDVAAWVADRQAPLPSDSGGTVTDFFGC